MYASIEPLLSSLSREFDAEFEVVPVAEDNSVIRVSLPDEVVGRPLAAGDLIVAIGSVEALDRLSAAVTS